MKHLIKATIFILILLALICTIAFLYINRYFPYSTGTHDHALLGTTFGMSLPEVKRCMAKHNATLLDAEAYKKAETTPLILIDSFTPLYSDDRSSNSTFTLYMPSIKMFNSITQAEFSFRNGQLKSVGIYFEPENVLEAPQLTEKLKEHLLTRYKYNSREESAEVPGAYTLLYSSNNVNAKMWVNHTDENKPITSIWLIHASNQEEKEQTIESREKDAF